MENPSLDSVMLTKDWSMIGKVIPWPFWTDHGVAYVADCASGDDRLQSNVARVGWEVKIAVIASPNVPVDARVAFSALRTDHAFPERSQSGGYLAGLAQYQKVGDNVGDEIESWFKPFYAGQA